MSEVDSAKREPAAWMYVLSAPVQPFHQPLSTGPRIKYPVVFAEMGVTLRQVTVVTEFAPRPVRPIRRTRFAIVLANGRRDDELARRFLDAYVGSFALIREPLFNDSPEALKVPYIKEQASRIGYADLVQWNPDVLDPFFDAMEFSTVTQVSPEYFIRAWELLPIVFAEPYLAASHYLDASLRDFSSLEVSAAERLGDEVYLNPARRQFIAFENALQNAYKVVEALIGEPPKDDEALREKIESIGANPEDLVDAHWSPKSGYCECLWETVKSMHAARDKRAAHVRTPKRRPLSYTELSMFQGAAWLMLWDAVQHELARRSAAD